MLNKVLAFFSEIIHNAWQWSYMTLLQPTPPPGSSPEPGQAHTQILISAAVQHVRDHVAWSRVFFKKIKNTRR